jgi:hypothetical protein
MELVPKIKISLSLLSLDNSCCILHMVKLTSKLQGETSLSLTQSHSLTTNTVPEPFKMRMDITS